MPVGIYDPDTDKGESLDEWRALGGQPPQAGSIQTAKPDGSHDKLPLTPEQRQAEIADRERNFNDSPDEQPAESGYFRDEPNGKDNKRKTSGSSPSRKRLISGIIIGVLFGGSMGFASIFAGPLQLIHLGQLMREFHLSSSELTSNSRLFQLATYMGDPGHPERLRMGFLANKYADRILGNLESKGYSFELTGKRANYAGVNIDPAKLPSDSAIAGIKDLDIEQSRKFISQQFNINPDAISFTEDGIIKISSSESGFFQNKGLIKGVLADAGVDGIAGAIEQRTIVKRIGLTAPWHPIQNLNTKIQGKLDSVWEKLSPYERWKAKWQNMMDGGGDVTTSTVIDPAAESTDKNGHTTVSPDATTVQGETNGVLADATDASESAKSGFTSNTGAFSKLASTTQFKIAAGGAAAVGVICAVKAIADNIDELKYLSIVKPAIRVATGFVAASSQVAYGNPVSGNSNDMASQVGYLVTALHDTAGNSDWTDAMSIHDEQGQANTGQDIPPEDKINNQANLASQIIHAIPGINTICKASASILGQAVSITLGFIGGPFSLIAGLVAGPLFVGPAIGHLVNLLANHPINVNIAGAPLGGIINMGTRLMATQNRISAGGRKLTKKESLQWKQLENDQLRQEQSQKSFAARLFDPMDSHSLAAQIIDKQSPDAGQNIASLLRGFGSIGGSIIRSSASLLSGKAMAAAAGSYDYGFDDYGFSVDELSSPIVTNPLANEDAVAGLLKSSKGQDYISKVKDCFGVTLDTGGNVDFTHDVIRYEKIPATCTDPSDDWLRIRMYLMDTQTIEAQACYEGEDSSCHLYSLPTVSDGGSGAAAFAPQHQNSFFSIMRMAYASVF